MCGAFVHFDVADLWGICPRYAEFLKSEGEPDGQQPDLWEGSGLPPLLRKQRIETALELKNCPDAWVRKHLTVKGLRPRKGLCCSRSFGRPVTTAEDLGEAVATHAVRGGEKLRRQRLAASHLTVFVSTSRFRQNPEEVCSGAASLRLPFPTSYMPALVAAARSLLERVYKPGFVYHKAGVSLTDIVAEAERQQSLLLRMDGEHRLRLMEAVDRINRKHGRHTVRPLAAGLGRGWEMMRRGRVSGRYTTRLDEVLRVIAC